MTTAANRTNKSQIQILANQRASTFSSWLTKTIKQVIIMANANVTALGYLGTHISFRDMDLSDIMSHISIKDFSDYRSGTVVAVQVPESSSGIEVLLLVRDATTQDDQYFRLDRIQIDEIRSL